MSQSYVYCGFLLRSTAVLELLPSAVRPADDNVLGEVRFSITADPPPDSDRVDWYHRHTIEGEDRPWLVVGRDAVGAELFRFTSGPWFRTIDGGRRIELFAATLPGATAVEAGGATLDLETEGLLLNQVLPLTLAHRGHLALHAAAVGFTEGAALFLGESGRGKSTLARYLVSEGQRLLSDDCAILALGDRPPRQVFPGYPAIRLRGEGGSEPGAAAGDGGSWLRGKRLVSLGGGGGDDLSFPLDPAQLVAVFCLEPVEHPEIDCRRLSRRDAHFALVRNAFRLDPGDRDRLRAEFDRLGCLAEQVAVFELRYPHDEQRLAAVADIIRRQLRVTAVSEPEDLAHV